MILVTGASGQLGQRVLSHLLETLAFPASQIVAASRSPEKLSVWAERGVVVRALDFDDPTTFAPALEGVERALLISSDAIGQRLEQHRRMITALAEAGVVHVLYTSMPQPENSPLLLAPEHEGTERALAESILPSWTILRNHWYFENLFLSLPAALASGKWYSADDNQGSADISRDDLAQVAATLLAGDSTGKTIYTLSGGEALTRTEVAAKLSAALERPLEVVPVPLEALVQGMIASGMPEPIARVFASFDTNTAAGRVATVTTDVERILGRQPQHFDAWLAENKAALSAL